MCAFRLEQGLPNFLWQSVGSRAARGKIAMRAITSRLNYCVIFIVIKLTEVVADGDPYFTACLKSKKNAIFKFARTLNNQIYLNM
jgi:hypothetical protein